MFKAVDVLNCLNDLNILNQTDRREVYANQNTARGYRQ